MSEDRNQPPSVPHSVAKLSFLAQKNRQRSAGHPLFNPSVGVLQVLDVSDERIEIWDVDQLMLVATILFDRYWLACIAKRNNAVVFSSKDEALEYTMLMLRITS